VPWTKKCACKLLCDFELSNFFHCVLRPSVLVAWLVWIGLVWVWFGLFWFGKGWVWFGCWASQLVGWSVGGKADAIVSFDVLFE
jgi:hypothetical protein